MLLGYHLRLAFRSFQRDRSFSLAMIVCLALASSIWAASLAHYLRLHERHQEWSREAHVVDALRPGIALSGGPFVAGDWRRQTLKLSWPEFRALQEDLGPRVSGNYRGHFLVGAEGGPPLAERIPGRFVDRTLFQLFPRDFAWGGAWTAAEERNQAPVVVLSRALNEALFQGENSVGRTLRVEGRSFRVVGVLAEPQPYLPDWDLSAGGADEEKLLVPLSLVAALAVRPEYEVNLAPRGRAFAALLASNEPFLTAWLALRPEEATSAQQKVNARLAPVAEARTRFVIRDVATHVALYPMPPSAADFFVLTCLLVIATGTFSVARLLLAKTAARYRENGVHRALGASRASLFVRTMLEAAFVATAGAALTLPLTQLLLGFFNARKMTNDIPLVMTWDLVVAATLPTLVLGLIAGLYPAWRVARTPPTTYLARAS